MTPPRSARRSPRAPASRVPASRVLACAVALAWGIAALAPTAAASAPPPTMATGGVTTATTAGAVSPNSSTQASDQAEAQQLTNQIDAQGRQLAQLAEETDAAQIHAQAIQSQVQTTQHTLTDTDQAVELATDQVREQAVDAYVGQPQPSLTGLAVDPNANDAIAVTYVETVAQVEQQSIDRLVSLRKTQTGQLATLHQQQVQAQQTLNALQADQADAQKAQASQETLLNGVQGNLATLVAADQQSQQQAQETQLANTEALPSTPEVTDAASSRQGSGGGAPTTRGSSAGSSAGAPTQTPATGQAAAPTQTTAPNQTTARPTSTSGPSQTTARPTPTTAAPTTTRAPTSTQPPAVAPPASSSPSPGWQVAIATAEAQIGKPYQWGGAGPNSYDCSGLVMVAWAAAGVSFPHLAQDQYNMTERIPLSSLLPGDLVFYGTPTDVYHVGIYVGGGDMVDAPETGQNVQIQSIYWDGLLGAGRVVG